MPKHLAGNSRKNCCALTGFLVILIWILGFYS